MRKLLLIVVYLSSFCAFANSNSARLRELYDELESMTEAGRSEALVDWKESVFNRYLQNVEARQDTFALRSLAQEIFRRMDANPQTVSDVSELQLKVLMQLSPVSNEKLRDRLDGLLNHGSQGMRWVALMHLRELYGESQPARWQIKALQVFEDTISRAQSSGKGRKAKDRVWDEFSLGNAVLSSVILSNQPVIPPLFSYVVRGFSGLESGAIRAEVLLDALTETDRSGNDPLVMAILNNIVSQARELVDLERKERRLGLHMNAALAKGLKTAVEVSIAKSVTEPTLLTELRVFLDDPALAQFAEVSLRDKFVDYFNSLDLNQSACRIYLLTPAQISGGPSAKALARSGVGTP